MQSPQDETVNQVFLTHLVGVFLKQNYTKYISDAVSKILKKKAQLLVLLSEFVSLLKLGVLWRKLKIFIANFFHVLPNGFWRIFSMMLSSLPTIKWR